MEEHTACSKPHKHHQAALRRANHDQEIDNHAIQGIGYLFNTDLAHPSPRFPADLPMRGDSVVRYHGQGDSLKDDQYRVIFLDDDNNPVAPPASRRFALVLPSIVTPPLSPTGIPHPYSFDDCDCLDCLSKERELVSGLSRGFLSIEAKSKLSSDGNQETTRQAKAMLEASHFRNNKKNKKSTETLIKPAPGTAHQEKQEGQGA